MTIHMNPKESLTIGIIGAGQMGQGIAEVFWFKKHKVLIYVIDDNKLSSALINLLVRLDKAIDKNRVEESLRLDIQDNIITCSQIFELKEADLIIEAVAERLDIKEKIFTQLNEVASDTCIVSSNTSSLSISELAQFYKLPQNFLGIHFFNPAPLLPLVEIIPHPGTLQEHTDTIYQILAHNGKMPVICKDSPGFIVNRLLLPLINHAGVLLDTQVASAKDIDKAMCLGANFPMGPLALADFIGLDVVISILNTLLQNFHNPIYHPASCFIDAVNQGNLGVKTKKGIFEYS